jgi:porphobilinogen synthase
MDLSSRPRRNRKSEAVRGWTRETTLGSEHLIAPLFVMETEGTEDIPSMPGQARLGPEALLAQAERVLEAGVRSVVLFPAIDDALKTPGAEEAANPEGLVPRCLQSLHRRFPELTLITDVALDPYSSDGHDGLVVDGRVVNDETVEVLCRQALSQARAGAHVIAPSDMMDGRVRAIREALDDEGYTEVSIMSYTAKYASAFYGPFRDALQSAPKSGDKKTYQMDPANVAEALREAAADEEEGADVLMVKPAGPYLDVIRAVREATTLPVAAYQVSGEYAMLKAAGACGWLDEPRVVMESLLGIRRAGASAILTYFALDAARWLRG